MTSCHGGWLVVAEIPWRVSKIFLGSSALYLLQIPFTSKRSSGILNYLLLGFLCLLKTEMLQMDKIDQSFNVFSLFCEMKTRPSCCAVQFVIISWTSVSTTPPCIFFSAWRIVSDGQLTLLLARRLQKYVIHAETLKILYPASSPDYMEWWWVMVCF